MSITPVRRFTLFDGMVLIAATGVGIAWTREVMKDVVEFFAYTTNLRGYLGWGMQGLGLGLPLLLTWTVTILGLRLRRPRARRRLLTRQPGLMACVMVTIMTALCGMIAVAFMILDGMQHDNGTTIRALVRSASDPVELLLVASSVIQAGVLCAWITLALTGRWRAERSWVDRAGRLLGILWIMGLPMTMMYWMMDVFF